MKSLLLIPLIVALSLALASGVLLAAGVRVNQIEPITATLIGSAAGVLGLLPLIRGSRDLTAIFQRALIGTILHLFAASALAAAAIALHVVDARLPSICWLMGGYWISLIALIIQLRRLMLNNIGLPGTLH
ncbi:MAG: hypothetical protein ABSF29_13430 [Tepidisphaeraceae bacterium]|jgi:hypothetical protein